ncbi:Alpha-N-acetylgalactosaminidase [Cryptotermes secundus]|uniref:Alpha-galactosidase n=2 Tax=Cryptotermes secundus TaxID=105785 RepID=A0A2J7Q6R5_9NEOP|nr:Alpha-N-acetylgalactosaminidase [Cryptotermes secundus]PNF24277.1 Alpha-N-acetylgalactosaminidase [Cryptotermes secundus]
MLVICVFAVSILTIVAALDNGLALTPPMGWLAWERYRCIVDCETYPNDCVSEQLFRRTADLLVSEGYADVGYEYIIIDDCWLAHERGSDGRLQPDPQRFPSGIKALADYIHSLGLKFGIYEDFGNYTCAGYPGVVGHMKTDAQTFADWEVDYVKLDGCYSEPEDMDTGYPEFGSYLNETGRPMIYSCSWPVYQEFAGIEPNFTALKQYCNLWRNYVDIDDSWEEVEIIMDYFAEKQDSIAEHAGPGHWNDPDMLIIGNYGLSYDQSKVQMAIWAILAAPLLMSTALRDVKPEYKDILQNKAILAINQDELGIQGRRVNNTGLIDIWTRPISPEFDGEYSYAVAFVSRRIDGYPYLKSVTLAEIGLTSACGYEFQDLYSPNTQPQILGPDSVLTVRINPSGVVFYRATIVGAR